jgi:hypothetical protein
MYSIWSLGPGNECQFLGGAGLISEAEAYYSHNQSISTVEKVIVDRLPVPGLPCLLVLHRIFQSRHLLLEFCICHAGIAAPGIYYLVRYRTNYIRAIYIWVSVSCD